LHRALEHNSCLELKQADGPGRVVSVDNRHTAGQDLPPKGKHLNRQHESRAWANWGAAVLRPY
jgi:hypothetical protein